MRQEVFRPVPMPSWRDEPDCKYLRLCAFARTLCGFARTSAGPTGPCRHPTRTMGWPRQTPDLQRERAKIRSVAGQEDGPLAATEGKLRPHHGEDRNGEAGHDDA